MDSVPLSARVTRLSALRRLIVLLSVFVAAVSALAQNAPTGLGAYANGANANNIYWNPVPGATGYNVYASTTSNGQGATPVGSNTYPAFSHTGLAAGVRVFYKVTALYGTSESARSAQISAKPGAERTGWPWVVCSTGSNSVTTRWSVVPNATMYHILRWEPLNGWLMVGTTNLGAYVDNTAINGVQYRYVVRPANADTDLQDSHQVYAVPGDSAPAIPDGLVAAPYNSGIILTWNPQPGVSGYVVYRGTSSNGQGSRPYYTVTSPYFNDGSLTGGSTYYYRVGAIDESGVSEKSTEASAKVAATILSAPYLAAAAGVDKVTLNWTAVPGATFYVLYRKAGDGAWENYQQQPNTTFNDLAVEPGVTYTYKVHAGNVEGIGYASYDQTAKIGSRLLNAPVGVYCRASTTSNQIFWNPSPGATAYNIYRGTNSTSQKLYVTNQGSGWSDPAATPGVRYFYRVAAYYKDTEGKKSALVSGKPGSVVLSATQLAAYPVAGKINLFWDKVPNATAYQIFRMTSGGNWLALKTNHALAAGAAYGSFIDNTAAPGVLQYYYVAGVYNDGTGANSNTVSVVPGNPPLAAPSGSWVFPGSNYLSVYVAPVSGATSYNVYRTQTSGSYTSMPYRVGIGSSFTDYDVAAGQTYYYRWVAVDQDGQSGFSPETSGIPGGTVPPAPILTLNTTGTTNNLAWSESAGASSYNIFRAPYGGSYSLLAQGVATRTYNDSAVTVGVRYYYQIYPVNVGGSGGISNTVSGRPGTVKPPAPNGVYGIQGNNYASLYWNPVLGATHYAVYMSTSPGGQGMVPIGFAGGTSFGIGGLTNFALHYFKVTAVTANTQGAKSVEFTVEPGTTRLAAVTLGAPTVTAGNVALAWNARAGATSYTVFRYFNGVWQTLAWGLTGTTYNDTSCIAGAQYIYYVCPVNSQGTGDGSNQRTIVAQ